MKRYADRQQPREIQRLVSSGLSLQEAVPYMGPWESRPFGVVAVSLSLSRSLRDRSGLQAWTSGS